MMLEDIIQKELMDKISSSKVATFMRNVNVTFVTKSDVEKLCKSLSLGSLQPGPNSVNYARIIEVLDMGETLRSMGIDSDLLLSKIPKTTDMRCLESVETISFSPLPDGLTTAIALNAVKLKIINISETQVIHEIGLPGK